MWRGRVDGAAPTANWQIELRAVDILTPLLDRTFPDTVIDSTYHAGCEDNVLGLPEPLIFGVMGADHPLWGGSVPVILEGKISTVGVDPTARRLLVCRGAMTINSVWYTPKDAGPGNAVDITASLGNASGIYAPGGANWADTPPGAGGFNYLDVSSRRFTVLYVNNAVWQTLAETQTHVLTVACTPTTYSGYNRGANHLAQILDNLVFRQSNTLDDYTYTDATFADGTVMRDYLNGGWSVAEGSAPDTAVKFMLKEPTTLRQILADACLSGPYWIGINQAGSVTCNSMSATPSLVGAHSDRDDILQGTFGIEGRPIWNIYKYQHTPNYVDGGFHGAGEISDATSIAKHGRLPAPEHAMAWWRTDPGVGAVLSNLNRTKLQRWDAGFIAGGTHGQEGGPQVGTRCYITHQEGIGGIVGYGDFLWSLSPTHFWRLGEQPESASTAALDYVPSGVSNGTYVGSPQRGIQGPWGDGSTGLLADGVNDEITLGGAVTLGTTVTFTFWLRPDSSQSPIYGTVFGLVSAGVYYKRNDKKLSVFYGAADHLNNTVLEDGVWYHVTISISAGAGTYYINGASDGTFSSYGGYNLTRLLENGTAGNFLKGAVKDLAVINGVALTGPQAAALYAARTLNRSAMGWTQRAMVVRSMGWRLGDLATSYKVEERVA